MKNTFEDHRDLAATRCIYCGTMKIRGTTGQFYCPNKHGSGLGPSTADQPESIPRGD